MKKYMFDFLQDQDRISFLLGGVSYKELSSKIETDKNEKSIKTVYPAVCGINTIFFLQSRQRIRFRFEWIPGIAANDVIKQFSDLQSLQYLHRRPTVFIGYQRDFRPPAAQFQQSFQRTGVEAGGISQMVGIKRRLFFERIIQIRILQIGQ